MCKIKDDNIRDVTAEESELDHDKLNEKFAQCKKDVEEEARKIKMAQDTMSEIACEVQKDLDPVIPILISEQDALMILKKSDIAEVKFLKTPPLALKMVLEAVCVLLGSKTDWREATKVMSAPDFLGRLIDYDKDNIPRSLLDQLRKYIEDPMFTPEAVAKTSSAGKSFCTWCCAMNTYARMTEAMEPKRKKLNQVQDSLATMTALLADKQAELTVLQEKKERLMQTLTQQLIDCKANKDYLEAQTAECAIMIQRGAAEEQGVTYANLTGDVLVKEGDLLTDEQVEEMNQEVSKMPSADLMMVMLKDKANNAELAIAVAAEMQVVEAKAEEIRVWFEEAVDAKKAATYTEIADSAQAGLAEALSALAVAVECLQTLNLSDIVELSRFQLNYTNVENASKRKQDLVGLVLTGLCIMLGTAPIYTNVEQTGKKKHDFLTPAKKMPGDPTRLPDSILDFDQKNITSDEGHSAYN